MTTDLELLQLPTDDSQSTALLRRPSVSQNRRHMVTRSRSADGLDSGSHSLVVLFCGCRVSGGGVSVMVGTVVVSGRFEGVGGGMVRGCRVEEGLPGQSAGPLTVECSDSAAARAAAGSAERPVGLG